MLYRHSRQGEQGTDLEEHMCRGAIKAEIDAAIAERRLLPPEVRAFPLAHATTYLQLVCEPVIIRKVLRAMQSDTIKRIREIRGGQPVLQNLGDWLEKKAESTNREIIWFIATFVRNNLLLSGLANRKERMPPVASLYAEQTESLGARLFHIEDLMEAIKESQNALMRGRD